MPTSATNNNARKNSTRASSAAGAATNGTGGAYARVREVAESALDLPVGTVLVLADRVGEVVEPWTDRDSAGRELRTLRAQLRREVNRVERRGGSARRKALTRARRTRRKLETTLRQNRRRAETTLRRRTRSAEAQIRRAQSQVGERIGALV